ncbi:zip-like iron-zinc transporter [Pseudohyphozyma bogoriensis]|nr:zip-like iron-zinc transporter [Pseudohyphozyma bogoriensis]
MQPPRVHHEEATRRRVEQPVLARAVLTISLIVKIVFMLLGVLLGILDYFQGTRPRSMSTRASLTPTPHRPNWWPTEEKCNTWISRLRKVSEEDLLKARAIAAGLQPGAALHQEILKFATLNDLAIVYASIVCGLRDLENEEVFTSVVHQPGPAPSRLPPGWVEDDEGDFVVMGFVVEFVSYTLE